MARSRPVRTSLLLAISRPPVLSESAPSMPWAFIVIASSATSPASTSSRVTARPPRDWTCRRTFSRDFVRSVFVRSKSEVVRSPRVSTE